MRGALADPLSGSAWSEPGTVSGFVRSSPNPTLLEYAAWNRFASCNRLLDVGCGAGRNAVPLAEDGWHVVGLDLSWPMLQAAAGRPVSGRLHLALAAMDALPVRDRSVDLVVAHGIWNLARSGAEFRRAVAEAARVCRPGGALFVFTFSRNTLPLGARPIEGETFVYTDFAGYPQCFLTHEQLDEELGRVGFCPDRRLPLAELNLPAAGGLRTGGAPVIYQGGFQLR